MNDEDEDELDEHGSEPHEPETVEEAWKRVQADIELGRKVKTRLNKRILVSDGLVLVNNGSTKLTGALDAPVIESMERLYHRFKHSIPSERSARSRSCNFVALPLEDLADDDLMYGDRRDDALARLEAFIVLAFASGQLVWTDEMEKKGTWFWKSENDPDFVLLRQWIEPITIQPNNNKTTTNLKETGSEESLLHD